MARKKILTSGIAITFFILMFIYAPFLQTQTNFIIQEQKQIHTIGNNVIPKNSGSNDWSMFQGNAQHVGAIDTTPQIHNGPIWNFTIASDELASPVIANGLVYIGSYDDNLYCLNASTGGQMWNYTTRGPIETSPAVSNGSIYLASADYYLYCLDANTSTEQWISQLYCGYESPIISNGIVYLPDDSYDKMNALNANTGVINWTAVPDFSYYGYTTVAVENGLVYAGTANGELVCWNANTGSLVWKYEKDSYSFSSPAIMNGLLYTGRSLVSSGCISCFNANNGSTVWTYDTTDAIESTPAIANGMVYAGGSDGNLYCVNANTGALIWKSTVGGALDSSPAIANGFVYIGGEDGYFYCLNGSTGIIDWKYNTGGEIVSSAAISNGLVYVGNFNGNLFCFPMFMLPSAPLGISLLPGNNQITLSWNASLNGGSPITAYKIYRGTSPGSEKLLTTLGNVTHYIDTGLTNSQTYYYEISAISSYGEGSKTSEQSGVPGSQGITSIPGMSIGEILSISMIGVIAVVFSVRKRLN